MRSRFSWTITVGVTLGLLATGWGLGTLLQPPVNAEECERTPCGDEARAAVVEPGQDILAEARAANGPQAPKPPKDFRQGHVKARRLDPGRIQRQGHGYRVSLPSGAPIPTPTVHNGLVLVGGGFRSKEFYAFDAESGDLAWGLDLDDDGPSSAVAEDGVVVFNTESCTVFALEARTGKHLWSYWLGDPLTSTPTIANGRVFTSYPAGGHSTPQQSVAQQAPQSAPTAGAGDDRSKPTDSWAQTPPYTHVLAAFDLRTGKILWQRWIDSDVMSAPVSSGDELIAATFSGTVYKFHQRTGEVLSARRSRATSAPVVAGKSLYFTRRADDGVAGETKEAMVAQDGKSGRQHYQAQNKVARYLKGAVQEATDYKAQSQQNDAANGFGGGAPPAANAKAAFDNIGQGNVSSMQAFQGSRILNRGAKNYATMGDEIVCTDAKTGKRSWSLALEGDLEKQGGFLGTSPAAAGDSVFVATLQGTVLRIDTDSGELVATYEIGSPLRAQPAIVDGRVYVGTTDGKLVMVDTEDRSLTGWSAWGGDAQHSGRVDD